MHQGLRSVREAYSPTRTATAATTDDSAPSIFDPTLEYSAERVVLSWQPLSNVSQGTPSSFVVDDVSCFCAEQ